MLFGDVASIVKCREQVQRKVQLQPDQQVVEPEKEVLEPSKTKVTLFVKSLQKEVTEQNLDEIFK